MDETSAFQYPVQDGGGQVLVVQDLSPLAEWLVGGEDHGPFPQMTIIDDMEQHIGCVLSVGQVPNLVNDQNVGMGVGLQRLL